MDVNMAYTLNAVDKITESCYIVVEMRGVVIESDLHQVLDELELGESTAFLMMSAKCTKGLR